MTISVKSSILRLAFIVCICLNELSLRAQEMDSYTVCGTVKEERSREVLKDAIINIRNADRIEIAECKTDDNGQFSFMAPTLGEYFCIVQKKGYRTRRQRVIVSGINGTLKIDIFLIPESDENEPDNADATDEPFIKGDDDRNVNHSVSGTVVEQEKIHKTVPIALSKVYLSNNIDIHKRAITPDDGSFSISAPDGHYILLIESTGHKSYVLEVDINGKDLDLGEVIMRIGEEIAPAGISSESPITRKGTRITYDVLKDPDAAIINMDEMIARIPDLHLSSKDGRLKYGTEDFGLILIDKNESGLINSRRQYPMEFIKADHMRQIEVVLPGDLEYGNDKPVLLIELAKELPYGLASNIEMSANSKKSFSPGIDAVINTPLIGIGLGYSYGHDNSPALLNESCREMTDPLSQVIRVETSKTRWEKSYSHNINANFFRTIAKDRIKLNATLNTSSSEAQYFSETISSTWMSDKSNVMSTTAVKGTSTSPLRLNGGLRISGSFGKPAGIQGKKENQWRLAYSFQNRMNESNDIYPSYNLSSCSEMKEHRVNCYVGWRNIINRRNFRFSTGINSGFYSRNYDNRSESAISNDGLDYCQQVAFINLTGLGEIWRKIGYTATINSEYLNNEGRFLNDGIRSPLDFSEFNINPSVGLNWNIKSNSFRSSYSRSVRRPGINQLNPYQDRSNPFSIVTGNPNLKGEMTDSYSLGYGIMPTLKWLRMCSVSITYSDTKNQISRIISSDENGIATSTFSNLGRSSNYAISLETILSPISRMEMILFASYSRTSSTLPSGLSNSVYYPSMSLSVNWYPKWFDMNGLLQYKPTIKSLQTVSLFMEPYVELSLSRYFRKPHIGISMSVSDVLHKGGMKESTIINSNFIQHNYAERLGRCYSISVYWRLGKFRQVENVTVEAYDSLTNP